MAQRLKRLPTMWETWVRSLGQEDPLEKEMATHSGILAWRIPWTEEPGKLQSIGSQKRRKRLTNSTVRMDQAQIRRARNVQEMTLGSCRIL